MHKTFRRAVYLYPLGGNEVVILKSAPALSGEDCPAPVLTEGGSGNEGGNNEVSGGPDYCKDPSNDCYAFIDILVLVHPNCAGSIFAGWRSQAELDVNAILLNSGIVNKQVRLLWMTLPSNISITISSSALTDVASFRNNANAQALRESRGADMMVLLSNTTWSSGGSTVFGSAFTDDAGFSPIVKNENAYCIVNLGASIVGRHTFAHELAHGWGARHAWGVDNRGDCGHAHFYTGASGTTQRTVLAPLATGGSRIPYYSNPSVIFDGFPTGVNGDPFTVSANNVQKIKNSTCDVQDYVKPAKLYAQINGPAAMCPGANINYQAWVTNGTEPNQTPATYTWSVSPSPSGPFTPLATNGANNAWVSANLGVPGSTFFLNLTIATNAGATTFRTSKAILVFSTCFEGGGIDDRAVEATPVQHDPNLYIAPNPAHGLVRFGTNEVTKTIHNVSIYSSNGVLVISSPTMPAGTKELTLDVSRLGTGLFYAKFFTNRGVQTKLLNIITN